MKSTLCTIALAAVVAIVSLTQANAQITQVSRVNVPFGFNRGTDHFAAGTYKVGICDGGILFSLIDSNGHKSLAIARRSDSRSSSKPGYVAFRKYGNTYFLAGYHLAGGATMTLVESKKERAVAHDFASNPTDTGDVQLALLSYPVTGR